MRDFVMKTHVAMALWVAILFSPPALAWPTTAESAMTDWIAQQAALKHHDSAAATPRNTPVDRHITRMLSVGAPSSARAGIQTIGDTALTQAEAMTSENLGPSCPEMTGWKSENTGSLLVGPGLYYFEQDDITGTQRDTTDLEKAFDFVEESNREKCDPSISKKACDESKIVIWQLNNENGSNEPDKQFLIYHRKKFLKQNLDHLTDKSISEVVGGWSGAGGKPSSASCIYWKDVDVEAKSQECRNAAGGDQVVQIATKRHVCSAASCQDARDKGLCFHTIVKEQCCHACTGWKGTPKEIAETIKGCKWTQDATRRGHVTAVGGASENFCNELGNLGEGVVGFGLEQCMTSTLLSSVTKPSCTVKCEEGFIGSPSPTGTYTCGTTGLHATTSLVCTRASGFVTVMCDADRQARGEC